MSDAYNGRHEGPLPRGTVTDMGRLFISAAHMSSGKTTISVGLAAALGARGLCVQSFKKGPDYIDPLWLARASGRPCYNLDFNTQTEPEIGALFGRHARSADLALIEGNKGLYDGLDPEGCDFERGARQTPRRAGCSCCRRDRNHPRRGAARARLSGLRPRRGDPRRDPEPGGVDAAGGKTTAGDRALYRRKRWSVSSVAIRS